MDQETKEFLEKLEFENGGTIRYKTYALFIGNPCGLPDRRPSAETGGLLYIINDKLIFEDFEKQNGIMGFLLPKRKSTYKKFKIEIELSAIDSLKAVRISEARTAVRKSSKDSESTPNIHELTGLRKKLFQKALCIESSKDDCWLLEVINTEDCIKGITELK